MIAVSNDFKQAMKEPIKELQAYITGDNIDIRDDTDLIQFKISAEAGLCKTAMRKLEVKLLSDYDLLGKWVHVGFGVKLANGTYEYLDYGSFQITESSSVKDTGVTTLVGYDKLVCSMVEYEPLEIEYPIGLYDYASLICETIGCEIGNLSFDVHNNWQINVDLWENITGTTYRDILEQIAQVTCTTVIVGNDDKIYFKPITETNESLDYDNLFKLTLNPLYGEINSVILGREPVEGEDVVRKDNQSIQENGLTEFRIDNNQIVDKDREGAIDDIYNALHGIQYYPFEITTEGLGWYEIADNFDIVNDNNDTFNTTLFNFSITIDGGIKETLKTVEENKTQTQYQYSTKVGKRIAQTEIIVDKQNQQIQSIVRDIGDRSGKTTTITQDLDGIESKVEDLEDVTVDAQSNNAVLEFEKINLSEPIEIRIHPLTESISYLYPRNNLYPSNTLYPKSRTLRFTASYEEYNEDLGENEIKTKDIDYILPDDLLYYNNNTYDEFYLNHKEEICRVIKRCGYNADGSVYALPQEVVVDYEYPTISLINGDYTISILGYNYGFIYAKLMTQNEFTEQFTTKAEMSSAIAQTAQEIRLEVDHKTDTDELIAKINLKPGHILLEGTVTANENFKILSDGSIEAKNGTFSGDIYLSDGGKVIGGQGVLANFQYMGKSYSFQYPNNVNDPSGKYFLGFNVHLDTTQSVPFHANKNYMIADINIPEGFTVKEAYITVVHDPIAYDDGTNSGVGYLRNLKAYDVTNSFGSDAFITGSEFQVGSNLSFDSNNEITEAFGTNGHTFSSNGTETINSGDISSIFNDPGTYSIAIQSAYNHSWSGNAYDITKSAPYTGFVSMYVNIIGYMTTNIESEED